MPPSVEERQPSNEEFVLRYRNPLARDFVIVSRVVLIGYPQLSDGAKVTYWVIYGHDWYEADRGGRKGYAYPTIRRLAQLRHTTDRTVQRHLADLIEAGLLTRVFRQGRPSILYIEEPSQEESRAYLRQTVGGDNSVRGGVTFLSPHKENENKNKKLVNGVENDLMGERSRGNKGWMPISQLLSTEAQPKKATTQDSWLADEIVSVTGDVQSLGCYRLVARRCPQTLVFEALSLLKEARQDGMIQKSRGALFIGIIRRLCRERNLPDPLQGRESGQASSYNGKSG